MHSHPLEAANYRTLPVLILVLMEDALVLADKGERISIKGVMS